MSEKIDVSVREILNYLTKTSGEEVAHQQINTHLGRLVNEAQLGVLERARTGVYKFRDPMLRAFVKMKIAERKLRDPEKYYQMKFKFV